MDRSVLEGDPHVVLEAMTIAGMQSGVTRVHLCACGISDRN